MQRFWCLPSVYVQHAQLGFSGRTAAMAQSQMMEAVDIQGDFQSHRLPLESAGANVPPNPWFLGSGGTTWGLPPAAPSFMGIEVGQNMVKASSSVMFPEPHLQPYRSIPILIFFGQEDFTSIQPTGLLRTLAGRSNSQLAVLMEFDLSNRQYLSTYTFVCQSVSQSVCLYVFRSIHLSIDLWSIDLSIYPSIYLSICPPKLIFSQSTLA